MSISTCALREEGDRLLKAQKEGKLYISIHALREEGDFSRKVYVFRFIISIHALREEGDQHGAAVGVKYYVFLSTPSARRATIWPIMLVAVASFLSTPSARRATCEAFFLRRQLCISIHALREEGDRDYNGAFWLVLDFYPRPPRGGRQLCPALFPDVMGISIHALREEGDILPCIG